MRRPPEPYLPEPYLSARLPVLDGNELAYEVTGSPEGLPVLYLHGGPGSATSPGYRTWIDPERQRIVGFDQRGCGRSRPLVTERLDLLDTNTTPAQVADIEALRRHLGIERWAVTGVSWGCTLALAYAQEHPDRVTAMALSAVTNTSTAEVEWITESMGRVFPKEWQEFSGAVPRKSGERVVDAYARAMRSPDSVLRAAAARAWCTWEDVHVSLAPGWEPDPRYRDPELRAVLTTLVTHYWSNSGFGGDGILERMDRIRDIPAVLVHGRHDVSSPLVTAWRLAERWPSAELLVTGDGHGGASSTDRMREAVRAFR